jgi:hypothetical protein
MTMVPLRRILPDVLVSVLRKAPLSPEKVAFAWRTAVGPSLDRVTTIELTGNVLRVRAQNAAWQREIERSAGLIRARLDSMLGDGIVAHIDVTDESSPGNTRAC